MKKSLLALAVLGVFAGAASAQSSVTIYGVMDLGIVKGNGGTATSNSNANGTSKAWTQKARTNSRLGFKGTEDLGNGLSAEFMIEHRLNPDSGTSTATEFWFGRSYVQLGSATMGKVYLGRDFSPAYWTAFYTDPSNWDGVGSMKGLQYAGFASSGTVNGTAGAAGSIRTDNTVGYRSPSFSGFTVDAAVGLGEGTTGRDSAINGQYRSGPIYAAVAYEKIAGGSFDKNSLFNIGGSYDLGVVKPMLYYARAKVSNGTLTNKAYSIAVSAPLGQGEGYVAYGRYDPNAANDVQTKIGLGYKHPLSKRTNLYVDFGQGKQDGGFTNNSAYDFGVKHTF